MQKKAALIELHHHSEVLRTFARLLYEEQWQIHIFTHQRVREDLYEVEVLSGVQWYLKQEKETDVFLNRHFSVLNDCDIVIWLTLFTPAALLNREDFKAKNILVLHNGNTFFAPYDHLLIRTTFPQMAADLFRLVRFWIFREAAKRKQLLERVDFISMASSNLQAFLHRRQADLAQRYPFIQPLPFVYFEGIPPEALQKREFLSIAVPGTVTGEGRDYEMLLNVFRQLAPELQGKLRLTLLGGAKSTYARKLIAAFEQIQNPCFEVISFPSFIPQKEYDIRLRQCDFLILPIKKSYPLGIIREVYGYTNISGGFNDLIRFGIPALVPDHYPLEQGVEPLTVAFTSESDLLDLLRKWITEKSYLQLRQLAPEALADYQKKALAKKMDQEITALLSQ